MPRPERPNFKGLVEKIPWVLGSLLKALSGCQPEGGQVPPGTPIEAPPVSPKDPSLVESKEE